MLKYLTRTVLNAWFFKNFYSVVNKSDNVLWVGSGGELHNKLLAQGYTLTSLDIDENRSPDIVGDVSKLKLDSNIYDVVCMIEVLEHVEVPIDALSEIKRVLKPGGFLILSVPFLINIHDAPHDHTRWTHFGLKKLMKGWKVIEISDRGGVVSTFIILLGRLLMEREMYKKIIAMMLLPMLVVVFYTINVLSLRSPKIRSYTPGYQVLAKKMLK